MFDKKEKNRRKEEEKKHQKYINKKGTKRETSKHER